MAQLLNFTSGGEVMERTSTFNDFFMAKRSFDVQFYLLFSQAILVKLMFVVFAKGARAIVDKKAWKKQFIALNKRTWTAMGVDFGDDETWYQAALFNFPLSFHHLVGGLLCVPSVFGVPGISKEVAFALARHGALFETAWEFQDIVTRFYQFIFKENWRKLNPPGLLKILAIHHACGMCAVIPMNLYFGNSVLYHESIFLLQGAAGISIGSQSYAYTLDLKKDSDVFKYKILSLIVLAVILYTRVFRFFSLGLELATLMYGSNFAIFALAMAASSLMSIFNVLLLLDALKKIS
uniref:TLC domain-containing protein n=1 Tax=Aplanochytrium stocchinoi TaxID=215587 RepID=A0A7S3V232_9STRA